MTWKGSGGWGGTITVEALKRGIPAVTAEAKGEGRCAESVVKEFEKMIMNILKAFKFIEGKPELPEKYTIFQGAFISCGKGGFYTQLVDIKEKVKKGQALAQITDLFGEVVETIKAPYDGVISSKRTFPSVQPGDWALAVGKVLEE